MTSRERVRKALNHEEPDRVPIDLGGTFMSGIQIGTYAKLRKKLGVDGSRPQVSELYQMLAEIEDPLREKLGVDTIPLPPRTGFFGIRHDEWKDWTTFDGTEVQVPKSFNYRIDDNGDLLLSPDGDVTKRPSGRMPKGGYYFDALVRQQPIETDKLDPVEFAEQFERFSEEDLEFLAETSRRLYEDTEYAITGLFGQGGFGDLPLVLAPWIEAPKGVRDSEEWIMSHVTRPDYITGIFEIQTQRALENLELYEQAIGDRIEMIVISGTDFGTQRSEMISVRMFEEMYLPYHKRLNAWVHENTSWKTLIHSCGSVPKLIPKFVEAGFDILNPIQVSAAGMDPVWLKETFGKELTFWGGGVDTQKTLPFGTPEEVREEVKERIKVFAPGGGYVFNTIHNIQENTSVENLLAMYDTVKEHGTYPIGV